MNPVIRLASRETGEYWEIPVLFEDASLLAINKPPLLAVGRDPGEPEKATLMELLHRDIKRNASWAQQRGIDFLANPHRLGFETTGVLLLAKSKAVFTDLAGQFGSEKPCRRYAALVRGTPKSDTLEVDLKLTPTLDRSGLVRPDPQRGKKAVTRLKVIEIFSRYALVECYPLTSRPHQIRVHMSRHRLPIVGDKLYGGGPLNLSSLKSSYRLKPGKTERPLISRTALHSEQIRVSHPETKQLLEIEAPWPNDLNVAVKYLRRYAPSRTPGPLIEKALDRGHNFQKDQIA